MTLYCHLIILAVALINACLGSMPKEIFGSLDLSLLKGDLTIKLNMTEADSLDVFSKGVSLSFYMEAVNVTDEPQLILSLYGNNVTVHRTSLLATPTERCYEISVLTPYNLNVTYTLKGNHSRQIYLDLYNVTDGKISLLYDDLVPVKGSEDKDWCAFKDKYLEETKENKADYLFNSTTITLEEVKKECIDKSEADEVCSGVTLTEDGNYSLRVGMALLESPNGSLSHVETWKYGHCISIDSTTPNGKMPKVFVLFATKDKIQLSHINVDPLRAYSSMRRYKRFELGNLVTGKYVNFKKIPYNVDYDPDNSFVEPIPNSSGARLLTRLNDVFALSEGTLMVVPERPSNLKMKLRVMGEQYQATSFWIANRIFYLNSSSDLLQVDMDGESTNVEILNTSPTKLSSYTLYSLPQDDLISMGNCSFKKLNNFTNNDIILLSFKTSQNGYRIKVNGNYFKYVLLNQSDEQEILHKMSANASLHSLTLLGATKEGCQLRKLTKDICNATVLYKDDGLYFIQRLRNTESIDTPCSADKSIAVNRQCNEGKLTTGFEACPIYQCVETNNRTHRQDIDNSGYRVRSMRAGESGSGKCCHGKWTYSCKENSEKYGRFNYTRCRRLQSCFDKPQIRIYFNISHGENRTVTSFVKPKKSLAPNRNDALDCPSGNGKVIIRCDGCEAEMTFVSHSCKPQFCLLHNEVQSFNLAWNPGSRTNNMTRHIKYGNGTEFKYTLSGSFSHLNGSKTVPCPYSGSVSISCIDAKFNKDFSSCVPAPRCPEKEIETHPLKGWFRFQSIFAAESVSVPCPRNPDKSALRRCHVNGKWGPLDDSKCEMFPCHSEQFNNRGVNFTTQETELDSYSNTTCDLPMCSNGSCGRRKCNSTTGMYSEPGYDTCSFNCSHMGVEIEHGSYSSFACLRNNGDEGKVYVQCYNNITTSNLCVLKTCPFEGGAGCVETDPKKLQGLDASELIEDFSSYLDNADLSTDKAKADTENVVNAVMTKSLSTTDSLGQENKEKVANLVDKVSMNLAKAGGKIVTASVAMYGIPATHRTARSADTNNYLSDIGIEGSGFKGDVGLAIYSNRDLFTPKNTSAEKLVSETVKSITTQHESPDVNVNISFSLTYRYNTSALSCVHYNTKTGDWLEDGCYTLVKDSTLVCQCSHLTSFAVLVSLDAIKSDSQSRVTKAVLCISCVALLTSIFCIMPFRKLRNRDIIKIHTFLMASILVANVAFLSLDFAAKSEVTCIVATCVTHFAWLSVFGWMVAEGLTMYNQTVLALQSYGKRSNNYICVLASSVYGGALVLPALGMILHFTVDNFHYIRPLDGGVCFMDVPGTLLYLFLIPLYLVLCCSLFIFIRVSIVVIQSKKQGKRKTENNDYWKKQLRAVISIATVTGISWIIAPFVILQHGKNNSYSLVMQWIFNISMGLQGVVIFIVLVALSDDVRNCWCEVIKNSKVGFALTSTNEASALKKEEKETTRSKISFLFPIPVYMAIALVYQADPKTQTSGRVEESATRTSLLDSVRASITKKNKPETLIKTDSLKPRRKYSEVFQSNGSFPKYPDSPSSDSWGKFVEGAQNGVISTNPGAQNGVISTNPGAQNGVISINPGAQNGVISTNPQNSI